MTRKERPTPSHAVNAIDSFSDSDESLIEQFAALNIETPGRSEAPRNIVETWNEYFRKGELADYQRLCRDLGIDGDVSSKRKCRRALGKIYVNVEQFLNARTKPDDVIRFRNIGALSRWTHHRQAYFPKFGIPKGSPLRTLLRILEQRAHRSLERWR